MADVAFHAPETGGRAVRPHLDGGLHPSVAFVFLGLLAAGLLFVAYSLYSDVEASGAKATAFLPYLLLFIALLIALGFEFVNGFHDTANAVATVIYTHSLPVQIAVLWSGSFNFLGVLLSSGAVAFGIISLLPVELILQVGSAAGFAMVFALLIAAIIWNLGTWYLGLPASSSHTLIGSIIGVGVANALSRGQDGTSGVDWGQATAIGKALVFSPVVGFVASALLLLVMKALIRKPELYRAPDSDRPPAWWIRGLLVFTCTAVSFAHGSNDGQKGMGLIMLILIGTVPTTYALNRALPDSQLARFSANSAAAEKVVEQKAAGYAVLGNPRPAVTEYVAHHQIDGGTYPSLAVLMKEIDKQVTEYGSLAKIPAAAVGNTRNDMYLADEALRLLMKDKAADLSTADIATLIAYKQSLDGATKYIPLWVKVAVAIALGLGTMVGWKRIVVTVGEKIGKTHLTYGQGAAAELVAAGTIAAADMYGAGIDHACVVVGGRRNHGGQRIGSTIVDPAQYRAGLGLDPADGDDAVGRTLHPVPQYFLTLRIRARPRCAALLSDLGGEHAGDRCHGPRRRDRSSRHGRCRGGQAVGGTRCQRPSRGQWGGQADRHSERGRSDPSCRDRHRKAPAVVARGRERRRHFGRGVRQVARQKSRRSHDIGGGRSVRGNAALRDCRAVRAKADQARARRKGRQGRRRGQPIQPDPGGRIGDRVDREHDETDR
jgi:inorganic phosphate transporter, PiT family